eukprot:g4878.t2
MAWVVFASIAALAMAPPVAQAFFLPPTSTLSRQTTLGPIRERSFLAEPTTGRAARPGCGVRCPAGGVAADGASGRRSRAVLSAGERSDPGGEEPTAGDTPRSPEEGPAFPSGKPAEPVGAAGAVEDEILMQIVGQDYGMLLRNIPPNEWVAEVAKAYPDDDEIKGMMGQVGKLMRMIDYYQAKNLKSTVGRHRRSKTKVNAGGQSYCLT